IEQDKTLIPTCAICLEPLNFFFDDTDKQVTTTNASDCTRDCLGHQKTSQPCGSFKETRTFNERGVGRRVKLSVKYTVKLLKQRYNKFRRKRLYSLSNALSVPAVSGVSSFCKALIRAKQLCEVGVKRVCGQASWADKEDQDGEPHHHGDTLVSGQQEILGVKRVCGQASWADKEDQDGEPHHHGDTLVSGQQEILGVTLTSGHISTGTSSCTASIYLL
ncbi:hypothetical protein C0J52_27920, partial [Blattella germanica]